VAQLIHKFTIERERLGVRSWKNERQRLLDYVVPEIGAMRLTDVRPRHLIEAYARITQKKYSTGKCLSQKTVDETHRTLSLAFAYGGVLEIIPGNDNPCEQVAHRYRTSSVKRDPRRRTTGSYTVEEVASLISRPDIPLYWRCLFAVEALAMTRAMEAGSLQFRDWNPTLENLYAEIGRRTLGELYVHGQKTDTPRWVPVHPELAALLAQWKEHGFEEVFGRPPAEEDLMFPYIQKPGSRKAQGTPVTSKVIWKELQTWLARLNMLSIDQPRRPQHGLRRAGSSAMADEGVSEHDRRCITHAPDLSNMQERYDAPAWRRLSECVLKIRLPLEKTAPPSAIAPSGAEKVHGLARTKTEFLSVFCRQPIEATEIPSKTYLEAAGIEPQSGRGNERTREDSSGQTIEVVGAWHSAPDTLSDSRGIERHRVPRNNRENTQQILRQIAAVLENGRELPAVAARQGARVLLESLLPQLSGRTAYAVEVAIWALRKAPARSIRETIVAKALVEFAIIDEESIDGDGSPNRGPHARDASLPEDN
jgi:integrase